MSLDDAIQDKLTIWANSLTEKLRENLVRKDAWYDQSTLAQSIVAKPVEVTADGFKVSIEMPDYAEYVDKGRGPTKQSKRLGGQTVQRRLQGPSGWIARRRIPPPMQIEIKRTNAKGEVKTYVKKFKNVNEANRSLSFAMSRKIHKQGYVSKGEGFYSEIFNDTTLTDLGKQLIPVLGEQVVVTLLNDVA